MVSTARTCIVPFVLAVLAASGCTRTPEPAPTPPLLAHEQTTRGEPCRRAVADYLAAREAANFCTSDDDCVELEPQPCLPAYHANIATVDRRLRAREAALAQTCGVSTDNCDRPAAGAPSCQEGRCVTHHPSQRTDRGRRSKHCWFERVRVLELDRPNILYLHGGPPDRPPQRGRLLIDEPGDLTLTIDMRGCLRPHRVLGIGPKETLHETRDTLHIYRVQVRPRELTIFSPHATVPDRCDYAIVTPHLVRPDGTTVPAKHHGIGHQPWCED